MQKLAKGQQLKQFQIHVKTQQNRLLSIQQQNVTYKTCGVHLKYSYMWVQPWSRVRAHDILALLKKRQVARAQRKASESF